MSAPELFESIRNYFNNLLGCGLFSTDSLEGWLCIFILGYFLWKLWRQAMNFVNWSICVLFLIQVGYWLSQTGFNDVINIAAVFRMDVLGSITALITNDMLRNILEAVNDFIRVTITSVWSMFSTGQLRSMVYDVITFNGLGGAL